MAIAAVPGISNLETVTPFLREFGPIMTVAFVLLFFVLLVGSVVIFRQAKALESLDGNVKLMLANQESIKAKASDIKSETSTFREMSKECISAVDQKCDQILTCLESHNDDIKSLGTITQEQIEVLNNISERIRDIFTYFINLLKRGEAK